MGSAATTVEAVYEYPFQAHAPLEPMNCTADMRKESCEVWAPTQTPETAFDDIVKTYGLPPEAVKVHTTLLGGGRPVQLLWTRPDDMRHGFFHTASVDRLRAGLSADGSWSSAISASIAVG